MVRIKPRSNIPSRYISVDPKTGDVDYRVPSACVHWPQLFRERIVRDWIGGSSMSKQQGESYVRYMTVSPFTVQRIGVQFFVKRHLIQPPNGRVLVETFLLADGHDKALNLYHSNPAVRSLMVYSYLTGDPINGLPKIRLTEDYQ